MRALALVTALGEGEPASWVETRAHHHDDADAIEMLETITRATADPSLPYGTRKDLYEAAIAANLPAIARLFLLASPAVPVPPTLKKQLGPERPLRPTERPLTLGERKSLARTHRRDKITLMVRDPHPDVVEILLSNPHVTESDIVKMAAARPAVPDSLAKIAAHSRWAVRHAIKRALVLKRNHQHGIGARKTAGAHMRVGAVALADHMVPAREIVDAVFLQQLEHVFCVMLVVNDESHFH